MAVLYLSDPVRGAVFRETLAAALPDLPFHEGEAPDPEAVRYLVAWTAPPDPTRLWPNLRLIFSVGAGVDQFDLGTIPPHVGIVRMLEPGIARQMREYATLAVLAMHRDLPRYLERQRRGCWQADGNAAARERRVGVLGLGNMGREVLDALRAFGFASADPTVDYKGLVHAFAESGGTGNRLLAGLRSLFAYKGQKKLIVFAVLFFVFAWGLDRLATERAWLASLDSVESLKSTAAWFATHRSWFATGSRLFDFAALACLGLLVWRAWRFTQPLWRGAALLDQDIALRKPDLERQIAHHAQRLDALTREADVMAERAAEAERRAGGPDRASHLAPNFLREGPSRSGQARAYFDALNAIVGGETAKSAGAAPARFVVAIDSLDRLPAERGLAILTTVATALARARNWKLKSRVCHPLDRPSRVRLSRGPVDHAFGRDQAGTQAADRRHIGIPDARQQPFAHDLRRR